MMKTEPCFTHNVNEKKIYKLSVDLINLIDIVFESVAL